MPAIQQQSETLRGQLVEWKTIRDGWGFGRLEFPNRSTVKVQGTPIGVRVGDSIELEGVWVEHQQYGKQFKFRSCAIVRTEGAAGAVKWMASRFPDVGEKRARELVERFGDELWHVIERAPARLAEVKGITPERAEAIGKAYKRVAGERDAMIKLRGWGLTDGQVQQCLNTWEDLDNVVDKLRANPYLLSQYVYGFGFLRADAIAKNMGVKPDAPERVRAGVEHVLDEARGDGHCYLWGAALQRMSAELLGVPPALVADAIKAAAKAQRLVRRGARVYAARMDVAEQECADNLLRLLAPARRAA